MWSVAARVPDRAGCIALTFRSSRNRKNVASFALYATRSLFRCTKFRCGVSSRCSGSHRLESEIWKDKSDMYVKESTCLWPIDGLTTSTVAQMYSSTGNTCEKQFRPSWSWREGEMSKQEATWPTIWSRWTWTSLMYKIQVSNCTTLLHPYICIW